MHYGQISDDRIHHRQHGGILGLERAMHHVVLELPVVFQRAEPMKSKGGESRSRVLGLSVDRSLLDDFFFGPGSNRPNIDFEASNMIRSGNQWLHLDFCAFREGWV